MGTQRNSVIKLTNEDQMMTPEPNRAPAPDDAIDRPQQPSSEDDDVRATTLHLVGAYQALLVEKRWDEWIQLWAEDGELCFAFAPPWAGNRSIAAEQRSWAT
jgi:hypothetical protein